MDRIVLIASDGMIFTDGKGVYGTTIYLAENRKKDEFYEITMEEYDSLINTTEEEAIE